MFTEFYCDPVNGSNLNAGSANAAPAYTGVGDSDGTSVFTPSDGSTPANTVSVGDFASVYVTAGATVTTFVGRVTNVAAGVNGAITVSTTAKSGTFPAASAGAHTISCVVGGYWQGPSGTTNFPFGFAAAVMKDTSSETLRVNFKNSATYSVTAAVTHNVAGLVVFQGFTTSAGDGGRAVLDGGTSGASYVLWANSGAGVTVRDFVFQNNGASGSANGVNSSGARCEFHRCVFSGFLGTGLNVTGQANVIECEAYNCNTSNTANQGGFIGGAAGCLFVRCISHDNAGNANNGFRLTSTCTLTGCIADTNGLHGFNAGTANLAMYFSGCVAYNNGGSGISNANSTPSFNIENCLFVLNGAFGVSVNAATGIVDMVNCAFYSNTSGDSQTTTTIQADGSITLSGDPFVDAANGDFRLNNTAGAGAACRGTGRGTFTETQASYTGTVGYPDVGAAQHQDTGGAGSSGSVVGPSNVLI